jgi:hypothetical protein
MVALSSKKSPKNALSSRSFARLAHLTHAISLTRELWRYGSLFGY